jgi:S-adenosylmethionine synthetase
MQSGIYSFDRWYDPVPTIQALSLPPGNRVYVANDTSIGVGYAPLSRLELLVLETERLITQKDRRHTHPAWGEDVKVMGVRSGDGVELTVACAMIGKYLAHIDDYLAQIQAIEQFARELAARHGFPDCKIHVNAADNPEEGAIYLTVTGTSAEGGDDGQVGRGNRVNGLITPCRPMSLEAAAGKNPFPCWETLCPCHGFQTGRKFRKLPRPNA